MFAILFRNLCDGFNVGRSMSMAIAFHVKSSSLVSEWDCVSERHFPGEVLIPATAILLLQAMAITIF